MFICEIFGLGKQTVEQKYQKARSNLAHFLRYKRYQHTQQGYDDACRIGDLLLKHLGALEQLRERGQLNDTHVDEFLQLVKQTEGLFPA